jgi:hypothetical protein
MKLTHKPGKGNTRHAMYGTPTYRSWYSMLSRCRNPNTPCYAYYGGRGIRVHHRWNDFAAFFADMGERPDGTTLDRINSDWNYEPGNCRWATRKEQSRNRAYTLKLTASGQTKTVSEWSEITGVKAATIQYRKRAGWSDEEAIR